MKLSIDNILLIGSILLFVSLVASRQTRYGIPTLLLFLLVGMLAGSDGPGGISFDDPKIAKFIGAVALSFILFSGGLETKWNDIKPVFWQGVSLSTIGVIITAATIGFLVYLLTDFTFLEGLLLGFNCFINRCSSGLLNFKVKEYRIKRESQTIARTGKRE